MRGQIVAKFLVRAFAVALLAAIAAFTWWAWQLFHGKPHSVDAMATRQFVQYLASDPESLSSLGLIDGSLLDFHSGRLSPRTQQELDRRDAVVARFRRELERFDPERLAPDQRLTYDIWRWWLDAEIEASAPFYAAPLGDPYVVSQFGIHASFPEYMTTTHALSNPKMARNYIKRLDAFPQAVDETIALFEDHAARGVMAPRVILERVIADIDKFTASAPPENVLVSSMRSRMEKSGAFPVASVNDFALQASDRVEKSV